MYLFIRAGIEVNTLRPRQNDRQYPGDIFKCILLNEIICISLKISLTFVPKFQLSSIGSDNGLAPTRRQAIIWTKDGSITDA